jgi:hypothetical protein
MIRWLVHAVGEADLSLVSQSRHRTGRDEVQASRRAMQQRLNDVRAAVDAGDRVRLERLLVAGAWDDAGRPAPGDPPLPRALAAVSDMAGPVPQPPARGDGGRVAGPVSQRPARGDGGRVAGPVPQPPARGDDGRVAEPTEGVRLVLVATRQTQHHPLDTAAAAQELCAAVERFPDLLGVPVTAADVAYVQRFGEAGVLEAVRPLLADTVRRGDRGAVTWGSGATTLALASVTALARAGLPWAFVDLPETGPARVVDPLENLEPDPVVALLVRWRMFRSLADLASGDRAPLRLDRPQQAVVERLARRWEQAHQEVTAEALRGLVADAVVRGDGTSGFAVRRYIEARYHELRAGEPGAVDLLEWAEEHGSGRLLGQRLERLCRPQTRSRLPAGELDRDSATWLLSGTTTALNRLGKRSSHELRAVSPKLAQQAAKALAVVPAARLIPAAGVDPAAGANPAVSVDTAVGVDAAELTSVGLPPAPVMPGLTVFAAWVVGAHLRKGDDPTIGAQLVADELGSLVRDHLGVTDQVGPEHRGGPTERRGGEESRRVVDLRVLLIATPDSAVAAETQRRELSTPPWPGLFQRVNAVVEVLPLGLSPAQAQDRVEAAVAGQISRISPSSRASTDLGAVVVVPTGLKELALPLVRAVRREGARRGVPMFLRELTSAEGSGPGVHLWPALADGDLPLLVAAREAVAELELDLAWRLLSATSVADSLAVRYRELRNAFVCADVDDPDSWPPGLPSPVPDRVERTLGLLSERLRLVRAVLAGAEGSTPSAPVRIRHLMLAAAALEATVGRVHPRRDGRVTLGPVRDKLHQLATEKRSRRSQRDAAYPLLVLDTARNDIPITHGQQADPDAAVRAAAATVAAETGTPSPSLRARLTDVPSLIEATADAADQLFTPAPGTCGTLEGLWRALGTQLNYEINERDSRRTSMALSGQHPRSG